MSALALRAPIDWTPPRDRGILAAVPRASAAAALAILAALSSPKRSAADEGPSQDAADAVKIAAAAFEYRDFQKVVDTLNPWVHPPRITDPKLMVEARRLLGVSFHVLGDLANAREEFGQLLLADPLHKLDPFVVPPKVIETFEAVRKEMKPALDRILAERGQLVKPETPVGPPKLVPVELPSRWITIIPGGVPQFVLEEPAWGAVLGSGQLLGLGLNLAGFFATENLLATDPSFDDWQTVQYAGAAAAIAFYAASIVLANLGFEEHNRSLLERASGRPGMVVEF